MREVCLRKENAYIHLGTLSKYLHIFKQAIQNTYGRTKSYFLLLTKLKKLANKFFFEKLSYKLLSFTSIAYFIH